MHRVLWLAAVVGLILAGCGSAPLPAAAHPKAPARGVVERRVGHLAVASIAQAVFHGALGPDWSLSGVAMTSSLNGWAAGTDLSLIAAAPSYALRTRDGGRQFTPVFAASMNISAVAAPDAQHAYFLENNCVNGGGCASSLQGLVNGADAPVTLWSSGTSEAVALSVPSAQDGFIAAVDTASASLGQNTLYATRDGGAQWTATPLPCLPAGYGENLDFPDAVHGWLVCDGTLGAGETLYTTVDGGLHWSRVLGSGPEWSDGSLLPQTFSAAISFEGATQGYMAIAGYGILATADGGFMWRTLRREDLPGGDPSAGLTIRPGGFGWQVENGALSLTQDGGLSWQTAYAFSMPPGLASASLLSARQAIGVVTGQAGQPQLLESANGGRSWEGKAYLPFDTFDLQALTESSYVAAGGSRVEETADAGRTWTGVALPRGWYVQALGFRTPQSGWVVAAARAGQGIFACSGRECIPLRAPFAPAVAVQTGPRSGFAAGTDLSGRPAVFTTSDGGRRWGEELLPAAFSLRGYPADFLGAGARGAVRWIYTSHVILRSTDGGATWTEITTPQPDPLVSVSYAGSGQGLAVTYGGSWWTPVWRSAAGGASFLLTGGER